MMSPPRSPIAPRSYTPRGRSPIAPRRGSGGWQKISPMRDIERPISPLRRGQSMSPMRGISTVEEPKQTPAENPEPVQDSVPEYHPTPKKDSTYLADKEEIKNSTGAIKKYRIPKKTGRTRGRSGVV